MIMSRSYGNSRYSLTLLPFTVSLGLIIGWKSVQKYSLKIRRDFFLCVGIAIGLNFAYHSGEYRTLTGSLLSGHDDLPWKMFSWISRMETGKAGNILVCDAPAFYYYTNQKGITYTGYYIQKPGGRGIVNEGNVDDIFRVPDKEERSIVHAFNRLKKDYGVSYVFTRAVPGDFRELSKLIEDGAEPVFREKSYTLYRLKEHALLDLTPAMTSNTMASLHRVIYSSRRDNSDWDGFRAFDDISTGHYGWHTPNGSQNEFIGLDFGVSNNTLINGYSLISNDTNPEMMPRDWIFEGSNDNRNWTALHRVKQQKDWASNERRDFYFPNTNPFRFYRVYIIAGNHPEYLLIGEIKFWFVAENFNVH